MIEKLVKRLAILTALCALCVSAQAAGVPERGRFADFTFAALDGFTTVITDTTGNEHTFAGVLQSASLEKNVAAARVASYAICRGEEQVLCVYLHDIAPEGGRQYSGAPGKAATNGYYSVELPVGAEDTAFFTGLSPSYLAELQSTALDAILTDSELSLEDISFIDTEKQYELYEDGSLTDTDMNMCWAASTANILHYTGWGEKAGFYSTDYLYEALIDEFDDGGSTAGFGLQWFFNGWNPGQEWSDWSHDESGYGSFGGYLPDYCAASFVHAQNVDSRSFPAVLDALRAGDGVELNFGWYWNWERVSGHSVTLWGAVYRTGSDLTNKEDWRALIISDSDSDVTHGDNRRTAPNTLNLQQITPVSAAGCDSWYFDAYHTDRVDGALSDGIIEGVTLLRAYSDTLAGDGGTRDTLTSPDPALDALETVELTEGIVNYTPYFAADSRVGVVFAVENQAHTPCTRGVDYSAVLTRQGTPVWTESGTVAAADMADGYELLPALYVGPLESGIYELSVTISCEGEAYLANDTLTKTVYVSDRAMQQDEMGFCVETVFDGPPNKNYYGHDSVGRLVFSDVTLPGFAVREYTVSVEYFSDDVLLETKTLYCGATFPTEVYGLKPQGDSISVAVYAIPQDPSAGYECYAGTDELELSYFRIEPSVEERDFTIFESDAALRGTDEVDLTFEKTAANKEDIDFKLVLYADDTEIFGNWIETSEFGANSTLDWYVRGFKVWNGKKWEPVRLPAGSYTLEAWVYYGTNNDGYYLYGDYVEIGTLTVLADSDRDLSASVGKVSDTAASVDFSFLTSSRDFTVCVDYGSASERGVASQYFADWDSGAVSGTITLDELQSQTEYSYTVSVYAGEDMTAAPVLTSESGSFTTTEAQTPTEPPVAPEQPEFALLAPGETVRTLTYGEETYLESFIPDEDGEWTFAFSGADGCVRVWDEGEWGEAVYFTQGGSGGKTLTLAVQSGTPVRLCVRAFMAGTYTVSYAPTTSAHASDDAGFYLTVAASDAEDCMVAAYSAQGQLLSVTAVGADDEMLSVTDANVDSVRIFRYEKTTGVPTAAALELAVR